MTLASIEARDFFDLVQDTKSQVYVTELGIKESAWHESDDISKSLKKARSKIRGLEKQISYLKLPSLDSLENLVGQIEGILRKSIADKAIRTLPDVMSILPEFVEAVVQKIDRSASQYADLGLRDSVILCSIRVFMKESEISEGFFVTMDGQLSKGGLLPILEEYPKGHLEDENTGILAEGDTEAEN